MIQSQQASYRARVAEQNKQLSREAAADEIALGHEQKRELGREQAQRLAAMRARMAANGGDLGFGSAAMALEDRSKTDSEDRAALAENINRKVRGLQIDAWNFESEKRAAKAESKSAIGEAAFGVASTALGGATEYAKFKAKKKTGS